MRVAQLLVWFLLVVAACESLSADSLLVKSKTLTVLGTLTDEITGDAEGGWALQLNPVIMVDGRQISALEIKSADKHKLLPLADKFVEARGKLTLVIKGENSRAPVFELWSIKEHKRKSKKE